MKRIILLAFILSYHLNFGQSDKTLFVYGGQVTKKFIKFTAELTNKENPKICFLPTAASDNQQYINYWYELCSDLKIEPKVLKVRNNSTTSKESFEKILMSMDAIIVGGGNTLNMLSDWKDRGIDLALKKVYEKGIIIAGGSAGSLCWFNAGITYSNPKKFTLVKGLGVLNYSHCPHYHSEKFRRLFYHKKILKKKLTNGYACDDKSGILFLNGKVNRSVSLDSKSFSYYVYEENGEIIEKKIASEIIK